MNLTQNYSSINPNSYPQGTNYNSIQSQNAPQYLTQNIPVTCNKEIILNRTENVIFHADKLELSVDVSGFRPEDIKCILKYNYIEIYAESWEVHQSKQVKLILHICHNLPQNVIPQLSACGLLPNGNLLLCTPWQT